MSESLYKVALITGASQGIGRAFAELLARQNWRIVLVARNKDDLASVCASLSGSGHTILPADLSTQAGLTLVIDALRLQNVTLLVNNAGNGWFGPTEQIDASVLHPLIALNITALTELSTAFLQRAERGAILINVGSVVGFFPYPPQAVYAAAKAFVVSFTSSLWVEWQPRGVRVVCLCPGTTDTGFFKRAGQNSMSRARKKLSPEQVASSALESAFTGNGPVSIPGLHNKLFVTLITRILPRMVAIRLITWLSRNF
jgi:short-subunit dehydrogenase